MSYLRVNFILVALIITAVIVNGKAVNDEACGENEVYNDCGTQCPPTCADIAGNQKPCNHMCVFGCFCVDGHVRQHDANTPCVKIAEC